MIFAHVRLYTGEIVKLYARDHVDLFYYRLKPYVERIVEVETTTVALRDMRQGRETKTEVPKE